MAVTIKLYNLAIDRVVRGNTDFDAVTVKCMLVSSSYTFSQTHDFRDDITNEVTGTGYTAAGAASAVTVTTEGGSNRTKIALGAVVWDATGGTLTARQAIYYVSRGGASSADELIACVTSDADVTATNASWTAAEQVIYFTNQNVS